MDEQLRQLMNDAQLEQQLAALGQVAEILGYYHRKLKANGLSDAEAFEIVRDYHSFMFSTSLMLSRSEGEQ
jgi:hypothetical protein